MSLLGSAAVAMWWDISAPARTEFEDWHSHEHFPERMGIPGFNRGSRWADADGGEGFFVLYELDDYETVASPGYLARLNQPTPWSTRMMPRHRNMVRSQCRIWESFGGGLARFMLSLRLSPQPELERALRRELGARLGSLAQRPGLAGGHLLKTETPAIGETAEQRIRGGDSVADWIVLVSGYDRAALATVAAKDLSRDALAAAGAAEAPVAGLYTLSYSLAKTDLPPPAD
jgi:hypothetical protein